MKSVVVLLILLISFNAYALSQEQLTFKKAYKLALKGDIKATKKAKKTLKDYRLSHYLDFALLKSQMPQLPTKQIKRFQKTYPNSPLSKDLDLMLIYELGKQQKWKRYLKKYKNNRSSNTKHCWYLLARIKTKKLKGLNQAIKDTWMNGLSLPDACNSVFSWWEKQGQITDALLQQRFNLSYKINNASTARYLANKMKTKPLWVSHAIGLMENPLTALVKSTGWKDDATHRELVYIKAKSMASKNPNKLHSLWKKLKKHFSFSQEQAAQVERTIALYAATDYLPFTISAMNKLPEKKHDAQINAWKVRYYLYKHNWKYVQKTINKMPEFQKNKDSWQYWLARSQAKIGLQAQAQRGFAKLAKKSNYYGFLAADHMRMPYTLCSKDIPSVPIKVMPNNLANAFELFELGMINQARKEWIIGYRELDTPQRRRLADIAMEKGWYNKVSAIMGALNLWDNYSMRYPLAYLEKITQLSTKYNLLPQWIMSIITQESAWKTDAISRADARGLMQLIDSTAKRLSKKLKLNYQGKHQLFDANFNLTLGTYYQRELFNRFDNHPLLALASYNAGETKAKHWLNGFPTSPDVWAETIPYQETRGYIRKILTNITIYDWLIHKKPARISSWMPTFPVNGKKVKKWPNKTLAAQKVEVVCHL